MKILENYYKPTPKKWRKIGDTLLAVSTFITASAIATQHTWIAITALITGSVGKILTNLFS